MKNVHRKKINIRLIIRRIFILIFCLTLIFSNFNIIPTVFAEVTPGTVEHIADADTTDSYPQLVALRQESRRAGRVWADKSVFTDSITLDMDTDGIKDGTTISNEYDFLHVFSTLGSSQMVEKKETIPLDVVFILDFSYSMGNGIVSGRENTRLYKTLDAVNNAINTLLSDVSADSRVGVAVYSNTGTQFVPLLNLVPEAGARNTQWLTVSDFGWASSDSTIKINGKARRALSKSSWTEVADIGTYCKNGTTVKTGNSTNLQSGLAAGMGMLADEEVTQWQSPRTGTDYDRIPITIIMTDGGCNTLSVSNDEKDTIDAKAWYDTKFTERRNTYADDKDVQYITAVSLPTLLTAAYNTARIASNYGQTPYAYGIAVDTQTVTQTQTPKIQITLDPKTYFNSRSTGYIKQTYNYYEQWLASKSDPLYVGKLPHGYYADSTKDIYISQLPKDSSPSKEEVVANLNYNTKGLIQVSSTDMDNVFKDIIHEVAGEKGDVFVPVDGSNDVGVSNSLSYMDPIGKYMEVKNVKNVLLFGELYDVEKSDKLKYFDKDDKEITNADAIKNGNYAYTKQHYNIKIPDSGDERLNPCYGSNNAIFRLSEIEIYVKKTGNFQDTDVGGGIESDTGNDEALYINIPAMALPMQVATVLLNSGGNAISYVTNVGDKEKDAPDVYLSKKAQSTPLRVFYEVGIAEEIKTADGNVDLTKVNPDYIVQNSNPAGDKVYFYSNWYKENIYSDYVTDGQYTYGDPVLTFSPSSDNRYYIFQNYHPVYANPTGDSKGGVVSGSDAEGWTLNGKSLGNPVKNKISPNTWYYILIEYYSPEGTIYFALPRLGGEFGSAVGGASDNEYLCWYNPETGDSVPYMNGNVPANPPSGSYVIATHPGGLRVGDMAAGIGIKTDANNKSTNVTATSNTYYLPTVSSSTGGENVVINLYLGNNGRLAVHDTQLLVTKTVGTLSGESNEVLRNTEFDYTVKLEGQSGEYSAIKAIRETITNANGEEETIWRALIKTVELLTNNHGLLQNNDGSIATVGLGPSGEIIPDGGQYYVYVGGESAGDNFTHTLFDSDEGHSFTEVLGTDKDITVTAYLVPVGYYTEYWRFDEKDTLLKKKDTFSVGQVERATIGFAVHTDYQSNTTYQTRTLYFGYAQNAWPEERPADWPMESWRNQPESTADFTLRDGEGLLFIGLESGTDYTVTEKLTQAQVTEGAALRYVTHKENGANNREKITTYYSDQDTPDASHDFNNTNHTYSVFGETTSVLTEEVHYFNYPPKVTKKQLSPDGGYVSVGDEVTYVIYWANDRIGEEETDIADVTVRDPLDPGVDFVDAEFVVQKVDGSFEKISSLPSGWTWTYDKDKHEVIWTIKNAAAGQSGFVRLTVTVNENAPFAFNENGENLGYPDNEITNKARVVLNDYEFSTDTVKTPMDGVHKTEVSVTKPGEDSTPVGADHGNLNQNAKTGNFVGPQVDKDWEIKYKISFTNYKTEAATVTVADRLDPDVKFVSAEYGSVTLTTESPNKTVEDGNVTIKYDKETRTVRWIIKDVGARAAGEVYLTVKVKSSADNGDDEEAEPPAPKVFEKYTPSGTALEEGRYIMVYNGNAMSNSFKIAKTSLAGTPVTITDDTILESDADATVMWDVVHSGNGFYLKNVANGQYLKIASNGADFVDGTASATLLKHYTATPGVLQGASGSPYFGYYSGGDFRGVSFAFYASAMTFYKLDESASTPTPEPPSTSKVFESVGGKINEPGTYLMVRDIGGTLGPVAANNTLYNGTSLWSTQVTVTDNKIATTDTSLMWDVVPGTGGFYLKNVENGQYLKSGGTTTAFTEKTDDATLWVNSVTDGVINSGTLYFGNFDSGQQFRGYNGSFYTFYIKGMTFYKLVESAPGEGTDPEEPGESELPPLEEPESGDYKVHNTASVKVANDAWQITETMENPLKPLTLPETGGRGFGLYVTFGSMLAMGMALWFIEKKVKYHKKC